MPQERIGPPLCRVSSWLRGSPGHSFSSMKIRGDDCNLRGRSRVSCGEGSQLRAEVEFDELYRTSRDRLVMQIAALTGDPSEARDFVQEAFIRAWTKWGQISTYEDPEGWVRRVAYRLAIGRWRRSRRLHLRADVRLEQVEIPGEQAGVIDALRRLPSMERRSIVLHHVCGLSVEEVATELRAPVGTIKSWLSRGRVRLASELGDSMEVINAKQQSSGC